MNKIILTIISLILTTQNYVAEVKIAMSSTRDIERSGSYVWAKTFADELTKAGMAARIYPSSTLGNEIVRTEQLLLGLLEVNMTGSQEVEMFSKLYGGIELPFLFLSPEELYLFHNDKKFINKVNESTIPYGMRVVDFAPLGGMTGLFTTDKAVRTIDDLASLRLRAMSSEQLEFFEAWDTAGTQVAWEEVPQALQTGIADGYLNPPIVAVQFGHGGQLDYFTNLNLSPSMRSVVMSEKWYQSLTSKQQNIVDAAILKARSVAKLWNVKTQQSEYQMLEDVTIKVIKLTDMQRQQFRAKILPLYKTLVSPAVFTEIQAILRSIREK